MKRLLLITESWPPAGSGGVQRPLHFARHLRRFGFQTEVLAPEIDDRRFPRDESLAPLVRDIPCLRIPLPRPFTDRLPGTPRRWLRRWVGAHLPDDVDLARPGFVDAATALHRKAAFDVILTTSPPHSLALVGLALRTRLGIPWVADFRDEWSRNRLRTRHLGARDRARDRALEARALTEADRVIVTTRTMREFALAVSGREPRHVTLIPNGYDPEDLPPRPLHRYGDRLVITYLGSLSSYRKLDGLFAAIRNLRAGTEPFPFLFRFITAADRVGRHFAGGEDLLREGVIRIDGYLPHRRALEEAARSDVLLHVLSNSGTEEEPVAGKLFEYIALGRPILFLTSVHGENERILEETGTGIVAELGNVQAMQLALEGIRRQWETRTLAAGARGHEIYARPALAGVLARELEAVLA